MRWFWQTSPSGTSLTNDAAQPLVVAQNGTYYLRAYNSTSQLWSTATGSPSRTVSINFIPSPPAQQNLAPFCLGQTGYAAIQPQTGLTAHWEIKNAQGSYDAVSSLQGKHYAEVENLSQSIEYRVRYRSAANCYSEHTYLIIQAQDCKEEDDYNFVRTYTARRKGITPSQITELDHTQVLTNTQYLDPLGRPMQQVAKQQSITGKDIIQPIVYDAYGQTTTQYLSYIEGEEGRFQPDALNKQAAFWQDSQKTGKAPENFPFAKVKLESSPLSRVLEQGGIGQSWNFAEDGGGGRTTEAKYAFNKANEVRIWKYDFDTKTISSTGWYASHQLSLQENLDTENHHSGVYTNKSGQTILTRVWESSTSSLDTYTVYDIFGQVRAIIPPKAVELLAQNNWNLYAIDPSSGESIFETYCYYYDYDAKGRTIAKKVPGAEVLYMVYDDWDRPILTQDAKLRYQNQVSNQWNFTKFDKQGRPVLSGLYRYSGSLTDPEAIRDWLQTQANAPVSYTQHTFTIGQGASAETYSMELTAFPAITSTQLRDATHHISFYENYDANADGTPDISYNTTYQSYFPAISQQADAPTPFYRLPDALTIQKTRILNGSQAGEWLTSAVFYNKEGEVIQSQSQNHLGGWDIGMSQSYFDGRLHRSLLVHQHDIDEDGQLEQYLVYEDYTYDALGTLLSTSQTIENSNLPSPQTEQLAAYEYNELGEVIRERIGQDDQNQAIQIIDYRYDLQGRLTHLNDAQLSNSGHQANEPDDLFGMEFAFEQALNGQTSLPRYDGNMTALRWKARSDEVERSYYYQYNALNQLTKAQYAHSNSTNVGEDFTMEKLTYDKNGNILSFSRKGLKKIHDSNGSLQFGDIDDLRYHYKGNQLVGVDDVLETSNNNLTGIAGDFSDGNGNANTPPRKYSIQSPEMGYDLNGNLSFDENQALTSITYNHLDLPEVISFGNGVQTGEIRYEYDATGSVLRKTVHADGELVATTVYSTGFVYEDDELAYMNTPNGRWLPPAKSPLADGKGYYQYFLNDHQGNLRVIFGKPQADTHTYATLEDANATQEENEFDLITRDGLHARSGEKSAKVNASHPVSLWKSYPMGKGDQLTGKVYAHYIQDHQQGTPIIIIPTLLPSSSSPITENGNNPRLLQLGVGVIVNPPSTPTLPHAYLKWEFFTENEQGELSLAASGHAPITPNAKTTWEELNLDFIAPQNGILQVYVANQSQSTEVWFDDMHLTWKHSPLAEEYHYDPFGMNLAGIERKGNHRFQYNAQAEKQKHPFLSSYHYETAYRAYSPQLGRFQGIDPLASDQTSITPYHYAGNNPVMFNDPNGDFLQVVFAAWKIYNVAKTIHYAVAGPGDFHSRMENLGRSFLIQMALPGADANTIAGGVAEGIGNYAISSIAGGGIKGLGDFIKPNHLFNMAISGASGAYQAKQNKTSRQKKVAEDDRRFSEIYYPDSIVGPDIIIEAKREGIAGSGVWTNYNEWWQQVDNPIGYAVRAATGSFANSYIIPAIQTGLSFTPAGQAADAALGLYNGDISALGNLGLGKLKGLSPALKIPTSAKGTALSRTYTLMDVNTKEVLKFGVTDADLNRMGKSIRLMENKVGKGNVHARYSLNTMTKREAHRMEKYLTTLHYNSTPNFLPKYQSYPHPINFFTGKRIPRP